jgi:N-acylneuraminate cytidylyltransferase
MGAEVIDRPAALAGDSATVDAAVRHALISTPPAPIVILYGNVPVRPAGCIDRAITLLGSSNADSVQSYAPVGKHHPWWTCRVDATSGVVTPWEGERLFHSTYRRQDLPPAYVPDGGVLVVSHDALFLRIPGVPEGPHAFLGREERRRAITTREGDVVDIDSPIDLLVADAILRSERTVEAKCPSTRACHRIGEQHA